MPKVKGEVTRDGLPHQWELAEQRRSLFQQWVEADYEVVDGVLRWVREPGDEGGGYLPMATPAIVGDFVRLRIGDEAALREFARRWGSLGYVSIVQRDSPGVYKQVNGDPVAWVWGHLGGIHTALALFKYWRDKDLEALSRYLNARRFPRARRRLGPINELLKSGKFHEAQRHMEGFFAEVSGRPESSGELLIVAGDGAQINGWIYPENTSTWPAAWMLIRRIINPNLRGVHAEISPYFPQHPNVPIVALGWDALLSVIYRHLFEILASGEIEECRECGTPFIRKDGRQRFCPPTPPARESACAMRFHKREQRRRKAEVSAAPETRP